MKTYLAAFAVVVSVTAGFARPYQVALITDDRTNIFWQYVYTGAANAVDDLKAKNIDVALTWDGPVNDSDAKAEQKIIEQKVAEHVDGIVLSPTADVPPIFDSVAAAAKAGVPTVVINAGLRSVGQISIVSTNNYKGGTLAARKMGALLKGKGKIVVFRWMAGNAASGGREAGFINVIRGQFPGIKILSDDQYANGDYASAKKTAAELVKRFGDEADGVFTPTQVTTETMLEAIRAAGLPKGKLAFIGFDSNEALINAMKAGEISGLVVQDPVKMGYEGVQTLVAHLRGNPVEKEVDTGCTLVTPDGLDEPAIRAVLDPKVKVYSPKP